MLTIEGLIYRPDIQNGLSFVNDLKTYEFVELHDEEGEAYVTECDWHGNPLKEGMLMFYYRSKSKGQRHHFYFQFPKEILEKTEYIEFFKAAKENEKRKYSEKEN